MAVVVTWPGVYDKLWTEGSLGSVNYYVSLSLSETSVKASSHKGSGGWPGPLAGGPLGPAQSSWGLSGPKDQRGPGNVRGELQASSSTVLPPLSPPGRPKSHSHCPMLLGSQLWALPSALHPCCSPAAPQHSGQPNKQAATYRPGAVPGGNTGFFRSHLEAEAREGTRARPGAPWWGH